MNVIGDGQFPRVVAVNDGRIFVYWIDGTDILVRVYDHLGMTLIPATIAVSGVDESVFDVDDYRTRDGQWRMNLIYRRGGQLEIVSSVDGVNFA